MQKMKTHKIFIGALLLAFVFTVSLLPATVLMYAFKKVSPDLAPLKVSSIAILVSPFGHKDDSHSHLSTNDFLFPLLTSLRYNSVI
jgi:hypothetical protein